MNIIRILPVLLVVVLGALTTVKCTTKNYYTELQSNINLLCNNKKVERWKCPIGKESERWRMEFCFYQCPDGTRYICREDTFHGLIEFCANDETCEKGTMNKVYFDDIHQQVITEKVSCAEGFFEPWTGNCFLNCQHKHQNLDFVPKTIVVFFKGNSTHSALGYCDVDNGYVNWDRYMYINISLEDYAHFCYKDDNYKTKCAAGQRLLPDSTCAPRCADGYVPDKENYFVCVPYIGNITTHSSFHPTAEVPKTSNISVISSTLPAKTTVSTTAAQQPTGDFHYRDATRGIMIVGVIIAVLILGAVGAIALFMYVHHKRHNRPGVIIADTYNHNSKITNILPNAENGTAIIKGAKYDVDHATVTRTSSGDTDLSLHGSDQSPDEVSTVDGSPDSGFLGLQNGQQLEVVADAQVDQLEVVADVHVDQSRNRKLGAEEDVDETDCKEFLLPQNMSRNIQPMAEEDEEETDCK